LPKWMLAIGAKLHSICSFTKKDEEIAELELQMEDEKESPSGIFYRQRMSKNEKGDLVASDSAEPLESMDKAQPAPLLTGKRARSRLMFYEHLFFKMDVSGTGIVDNEEMKRFLAYSNLEMDQPARDAALTKADVTGDGNMVRWEFVLLCIDTLEYVPVDELKLALDNYLMAISANERRNEARWKAAAKTLDLYTRLLLPLGYCTFLGVHFNTTYEDYYESDPTLPMFSGFGPSSMTPAGVGMAMIVPAIAIFSFASWWIAKTCAVKSKLVEGKPSHSEIIAKKTASFGQQQMRMSSGGMSPNTFNSISQQSATTS